MWEKAFIGDDGSQVRRKRPVRPCGLTSKGLSLCLFELNYRIRGRTLRDESLETNTARDLEQVVRMFVEMDVGPVSPSSTTWYEKKRSETNHWTGVTQGTWNKSCGYYGKWTSFLLFRVRMLRMWGRKTEDKKELTSELFLLFLNSKPFTLRRALRTQLLHFSNCTSPWTPPCLSLSSPLP